MNGQYMWLLSVGIVPDYLQIVIRHVVELKPMQYGSLSAIDNSGDQHYRQCQHDKLINLIRPRKHNHPNECLPPLDYCTEALGWKRGMFCHDCWPLQGSEHAKLNHHFRTFTDRQGPRSHNRVMSCVLANVPLLICQRLDLLSESFTDHELWLWYGCLPWCTLLCYTEVLTRP